MCFDQRGVISTLNGSSVKLVNKFTYQGSSVSSIERDINTRLAKAWTAIDRIKCSFFQAAVQSIIPYGCTTWTLSKHMEKKLDGNCTRMLRAIMNKSWRQCPTKQQLYGHLILIRKTIQVKRTRRVVNCWRSKYELISHIFLWTLFTWTSKERTTSENLYTTALCRSMI